LKVLKPRRGIRPGVLRHHIAAFLQNKQFLQNEFIFIFNIMILK